MLEAVGNACQLCGDDDRTTRLCVDHCHVTGKVRGVLCRKCNKGIGALGDTAEAVQRAADYLRAAEGTEGAHHAS